MPSESSGYPVTIHKNGSREERVTLGHISAAGTLELSNLSTYEVRDSDLTVNTHDMSIVVEGYREPSPDSEMMWWEENKALREENERTQMGLFRDNDGHTTDTEPARFIPTLGEGNTVSMSHNVYGDYVTYSSYACERAARLKLEATLDSIKELTKHGYEDALRIRENLPARPKSDRQQPGSFNE